MAKYGKRLVFNKQQKSSSNKLEHAILMVCWIASFCFNFLLKLLKKRVCSIAASDLSKTTAVCLHPATYVFLKMKAILVPRKKPHLDSLGIENSVI